VENCLFLEQMVEKWYNLNQQKGAAYVALAYA
jgi:hypothetical protein